MKEFTINKKVRGAKQQLSVHNVGNNLDNDNNVTHIDTTQIYLKLTMYLYGISFVHFCQPVSKTTHYQPDSTPFQLLISTQIAYSNLSNGHFYNKDIFCDSDSGLSIQIWLRVYVSMEKMWK